MLLQELHLCNMCNLRKGTSAPVPPEGDPSSGLVIVGRSPGFDEQKGVHPFIGPGGKCLDRLLDSANIDRSKIWITNLVKCGSGMVQDLPPTDHNVSSCRKFLDLELFIIKPKLVLLLGNQVIRSFFPAAETVSISRGRVIVDTKLQTEAGDISFVSIWLLHPGYILRKPGLEDTSIKEEWPIVVKYINELGLQKVFKL